MRRILPALLLLCATALPAVAQDRGSTLPSHPLERRALTEPDAVLAEIPPLLRAAEREGRSRDAALLLVARANACRVVADWGCQRQSGALARTAADKAGDTILAIRGVILESRADIGLQDYTRAERLLGEAELMLRTAPSPELSADVDLAYSSLSYALGKHELARKYAEQGLVHLRDGEAPALRVRLMRNQGRALAYLGRVDDGRAVLERALVLADELVDPKLAAELYLEDARLARIAKDQDGQRRNGEKVIELGRRLRNSQLDGQGHEVLGLAALDAGRREDAARELRAAVGSFRGLKLPRDELRATRALLGLYAQLERHDEMVPLVRRYIDLESDIDSADRAQASDDFDARLKYAEQEKAVLRLESEAKLAAERERALGEQNRLTSLLVGLALVTLVVLGAFFVQQRRSNRRLRETLSALRESEARATDLLRLSSGFVFLHDTEGRLLMVNPATAHALGQEAPELVGRSLREFMPADAAPEFEAYLERVEQKTRDEGTLRLEPEPGEKLHWRYSNRLSEAEPGRAYIIGHAVDVTEQIAQAVALREQNLQDALTGTRNRRWLEEFERRVGRAGTWAVVVFDLDHFKQINDTRGHEEGDRVLVAFAKFLTANLREDDAVVRSGGDEFLIVLANAGEPALSALLDRLYDDLVRAPCAFSMGSALRHGDEPLSATIERADKAMYSERARRRG
ncbi:MAG TPA: GGDEF domain-containing protein [Xanthomonadales bacterium]|nr:GGDEF domain-containing protein [Xanthomonadales bacterium]